MRPSGRSNADRPLRALAGIARTDALARLTLAASAVTVVAYIALHRAGIVDPIARRWLSFVFLGLAVASLGRGLGKVRPARERVFWTDLLIAFFSWWALTVILLFYPRPREQPIVVLILAEVLLGVFYVILVLAVERQPPDDPTVEHLEAEDRTLVIPAVTVFVLGLEVYFVLIPLFLSRESYLALLPSLYLFVFLDLFLLGRLFYLSRRARRPGWRTIYSILLTAVAGMTVSDTLDYLVVAGHLDVRRGSLWDLVLLPQFVLVALAARLRSLPAPVATFPTRREVRPSEPLPSLSRQSMAFAFGLSVLHFGGHGLGLSLMGEESRSAREVVLGIWVVFLVTIAFLQHRFLEQKAQGLWEESLFAERQLQRKASGILLSLERRKADEAIDAAEERFSQIFAKSPRPMAIVTVAEGRLLEANDAFCESTGYLRDEIVGLGLGDLEILGEVECGAILAEVAAAGRVRRRLAELNGRGGQRRPVRLSAEPVELDALPCLLLMTEEVPAPLPEGRTP